MKGKRRSRTISVPQLVREERDSAEAALRRLTRHLKGVAGTRYNAAALYHAEILQWDAEAAAAAGECRSSRWKALGLALPFYGAAVLAAAWLRPLLPGIEYRAGVSVILAALILLTLLGALRAMGKAEGGISLWVEHRRLAGELLGATTRIREFIGLVLSREGGGAPGRGREFGDLGPWLKGVAGFGAVASAVLAALAVWM